MDKASPKLFEESCTGTSLGDVTIHACRTSDGLDEYLEYKLSNVIVSHYDVSAADNGENDDLLETVHLNFTKVQMKYIPRNANNQSESPIIAGYSLETASKL